MRITRDLLLVARLVQAIALRAVWHPDKARTERIIMPFLPSKNTHEVKQLTSSTLEGTYLRYCCRCPDMWLDCCGSIYLTNRHGFSINTADKGERGRWLQSLRAAKMWWGPEAVRLAAWYTQRGKMPIARAASRFEVAAYAPEIQ